MERHSMFLMQEHREKNDARIKEVLGTTGVAVFVATTGLALFLDEPMAFKFICYGAATMIAVAAVFCTRTKATVLLQKIILEACAVLQFIMYMAVTIPIKLLVGGPRGVLKYIQIHGTYFLRREATRWVK